MTTPQVPASDDGWTCSVYEQTPGLTYKIVAKHGSREAHNLRGLVVEKVVPADVMRFDAQAAWDGRWVRSVAGSMQPKEAVK